jgi:hypothetical protein
MGKCSTKINKITFDFTDEQITEVTVEGDFWGDCPMQMKRLYKKSFPARMSAIDIINAKDGVQNYIMWN